MKVATENEKRSSGKTILGAAGGGLLFGGAGAIIGAGLGSMKKVDATVFMSLKDLDGGDVFTIEIKPGLKQSRLDLPKFRIAGKMPSVAGESM